MNLDMISANSKTKVGFIAAIFVFVGLLQLLTLPEMPVYLEKSVERMRGASVRPVLQSKISRGMSADDFGMITRNLMEASFKTSLVEKPDYLQKYFMYDSTAKQALFELNAWLYENHVPLPLFANRLAAGYDNSKSPKICVSVATARRQGSPLASIAQAISSLITRMNFAAHKDDVYIHVFNVDSRPEEHTDVDLIRNLVPVTNIKVSIKSDDPNFPIKSHYHENLDNAQIMRHLHDIGCEYPIMIEDDALAAEDWVNSVLLAIAQLEARKKNDWLAIKLFVARSSYPKLTSRGINLYDPRFNTVAVLYNRSLMLDLAQAIESMVNHTVAMKDHSLHSPKDLFLDQYSREHQFLIQAFEPVIFQHTGVYSSVSDRTPDEDSVKSWIMYSKYFESDGKPIVFDKLNWRDISLSTL
jgi:hypothetical protein